MAQQVQLRRGTSAEWSATDPILAEGEIGIDTTLSLFKIGDGVNVWSDLLFIEGEMPTSGTTGQCLVKASNTDYDVEWGDRVVSNVAITGDTKCKITYDDKGLVTAGDDISGSDLLSVNAIYSANTDTTYSLQASDNAKFLKFTNGATITITLPNSLSTGFQCAFYQGGDGQIQFSAASGATLRNRSSHTKMAGKYAAGGLFVISNSDGSSAEYLLTGDTAA